MSYQFESIALPFLVSLVCTLILVTVLVRIVDRREGQALLLWALNASAWCLASAAQIMTTSPGQEVLWHNLRLLWASVSGIVFFLTISAYSDRTHWFRLPYAAVLAGLPLMNMMLVWTNDAHGLVWRSIEESANGPLLTEPIPGPWFVIHAVATYGILLIAIYWLASEFIQRHREGVYRRQIKLLVLSFFIAMTPNFVYHLGMTTIDWTPVGNAGGAIVLTVAIFRYRFLDISPIARDSVVETMDNAMVVADTDDRIVDANQQAATVFDTDISTMVGTPLEALLSDHPSVYETVEKNGQQSHQVDVTIDGESRHYEVSVTPIDDPTGSFVGRVILFSDVTEGVMRRQQLEQQTQQLERQNERLDQFASVVSHDLRNPLGIAKTYLDFARETCETDDLDTVEESLDRMDAMIGDLLTMARAGTSVDDTESIALAAVAEDAWNTAQTNGATFSTEFDETTIEGDRSLIQNVFENLFRNAVDHNEPPVTVRVGLLDAPGFYVEDDGEGIAPDQRGDVLKFGHTTSENGTGFGLAIVRELIEAHGWEISVTESATGGARFEIYTGDQKISVDPASSDANSR